MIINNIGISDEGFERLYTLMEQDMGISVVPDITYDHDREYWIKLLEYSERWYSFCDRNGLLFPVLHKIHWKQYPDCEYSDVQKEILGVLEDVIKTDDIAKATWVNDEYFLHQLCMMRVSQTAYTKAAPYYISECHEQYMNGRSNNAIYCGVFSDKEDKDPYPEVYESLIKEILPEAQTWPVEAWSGEKEIYKGLAEKYGVVYPGEDDFMDGLDYSSLMCILEEKYYGKEWETYLLAGLQTCTMDMAAVIWSKDTVKSMIEDFCRIGEDIKNKRMMPADAEDVFTCWLYKTVCEWLDTNAIPSDLYCKAKEARFNIELLGA